MNSLLPYLTLERAGSPDATVGIISLPLPRELAGHLQIDHPRAAMHPVAWWARNQVPRRVLALVPDQEGLPDRLWLQEGQPLTAYQAPQWQVQTQITREKLEFTRHAFTDIASLRGVPADECTTVEGALQLTYCGRTLELQFGATGPRGGPYYWQNVQVDFLWSNSAARAMRVGGIIYNEDTYLWVDAYLLLFSNGVAHLAAHFVNTKLHIQGYDFQGLPLLRLAGDLLEPVNAALPVDGHRFSLGGVQLNLADSEPLCSPEYPGRLTGTGGELFWYPVSRIFNPQVENSPELQWEPGFARTVRLQFSLSDAAPVLARYRAPAWWYAVCGEPWPGRYLPVSGRYTPLGDETTRHLQAGMTRGRFDAGSTGFGNDGDAGMGMMHSYYRTGDPETFKDALDYCYYWADLAVDHTDYSVHQWVGGWGWKTCAYSKFRDILYGYLETADPYLLDTVEMAAESYWAWFRSNWPRSAIGRDAFEIGGWALLWRFLDSQHARERTQELVRMVGAVLDTRGVIGGQMGAGPHPGYLSSLYMTGVAMVSLLDAAEAEIESGDPNGLPRLLDLLWKLDSHFRRNDIELFPSDYGLPRKDWGPTGRGCWAVLASRIYPEIMRLTSAQDPRLQTGLRMSIQEDLPPLQEWARSGRWGNHLVHPLYHDALLLGVQIQEDGISISPLGPPDLWPPVAIVSTPFGSLTLQVDCGESQTRLEFAADHSFPVQVSWHGSLYSTTSQSACRLPSNHLTSLTH